MNNAEREFVMRSKKKCSCKKDIDFLIFYEVKTREIDSIALLRNELVRRGYVVEVLCFAEAAYPAKFVRFRNRVKAAVMPSLYHSEEIMQHVYFAAGKVDYIINLQWEQVWRISTESDPEAYNYPKGAARDAFHLCWGLQEASNMINALVPQNRIIVTGPLHMDFYRDEYRLLLKSPSVSLHECGIDSKKNVVLFISSYVLDRSLCIGEKKRLDKKELSYIRTLEWIERLLQEMGGEIEFIYRPHPVEIDNPLIGRLEDLYDSFHIVDRGTIKEWIGQCDRVCTWVSTSIADTYFAGIPCAIIRPVALPYEWEMATYRNAHLTETYEEFTDFIRIGGTIAADPDVIKKYYDVSSEKSVNRICDALEEILESPQRFNWNSLPIQEFDESFTARIMKKRIRGFFYRFCKRALPILKLFDAHAKLSPTRYANKFGQQWLDNIVTKDELVSIYKRWDVRACSLDTRSS